MININSALPSVYRRYLRILLMEKYIAVLEEGKGR